MQNHPAPDPEVTARATLSGVLTDLREVAGQLPVPADQIEHVARILDRLAEEVSEAAAMLRGRQPEPPAADQRVIVAREFLDAITEYKVVSRPLSVLQREDAELRRMLAALLDVIDGTAQGPAS